MIFQPSDDPLDVTLLVFPGCSLLSLAATLDPMRGANRVLGRTLYRWTLASMDGSAPVASCGLPIPVDGSFEPRAARDALIVLAAFDADAHLTAETLAALRRAARGCRAVGGIEAGSWFLAAAGLLDGRRATTHWEDLEAFAARFPSVDVRPERWVVDGGVFTTGGATPALDLMLALVRARQGYSAALGVASLYIYEEVRTASDIQPAVSLGRIRQHEPRVAGAVAIMEAHIDAPLPIPAIARRVGVSVRALEMLFRQAVGTSPGAYYASLRLGAARRLVVDTKLSMVETAERTGFGSGAALSRAFRNRFGETPSAARRGRP